MTNPSTWNATAFFENLTQSNRLATSKKFVFCRVSGLEGFEEALGEMQQANNFVCVSDIADGYTELNNTPRTRRVKTVFFAMRHAIDDMAARADCFDVMQELFRQFMSVLILQRIKLEEQCIYIDPRITFNEIDRYFFSGCACAYFQVAVDKYTDLRYNADEWQDHYAEVGEDEYISNPKYLNIKDYVNHEENTQHNFGNILQIICDLTGTEKNLAMAKRMREQVPFSIAIPRGTNINELRSRLKETQAIYTLSVENEFKLFDPTA